jgi:hypothetical protein
MHGHAFDLAMKLNKILDCKPCRIKTSVIRRILINGEVNIVDYLENNYGNIMNLSSFDRNTRSEITTVFRDRMLTINYERKWGIKNDGIGVLLAFAIELLSNTGGVHWEPATGLFYN